MYVSMERLGRAVDYIERRLTEPFTLDDVAAAAGLNRFALHRLFGAALGESLKGYVRKRRLTEAAGQLRGTDRRILEVAMEAGFGSQEAFTRAFSAYFGVPPGRYRRDASLRGQPGLLRATPRSLAHRARGVTHEPRLVERTEPLRLVGWGVGADFEDDTPIVALWEAVLEALERGGGVPETLYGVAAASQERLELGPEQTLAYVAAVEDGGAVFGARALEVTVEPGLYAVFDHRGPLDQIVETVNYAWASWLPRSGRRAMGCDLEVVPREAMASEEPRMELWVGVG